MLLLFGVKQIKKNQAHAKIPQMPQQSSTKIANDLRITIASIHGKSKANIFWIMHGKIYIEIHTIFFFFSLFGYEWYRNAIDLYFGDEPNGMMMLGYFWLVLCAW